MEVCERFKQAEAKIAERTTRIRAIWLQTKSQLHFVERLAPIIEDEHRRLQEDLLLVFASKLKVASEKFGSYLKKVEGKTSPSDEWQVKTWKYAWLGKDLDVAIDELEVWRGKFDPSWFLIMKAASPQVDVELENLKTAMSHTASPPLSHAQLLRAAVHNRLQPDRGIILPSHGLAAVRAS